MVVVLVVVVVVVVGSFELVGGDVEAYSTWLFLSPTANSEDHRSDTPTKPNIVDTTYEPFSP